MELLLEEGYQVTVLDNFSTGRPDNLTHVVDKIQLIHCDLTTQGAWQKVFEEVDWVFHLAALADIVPSIQQPQAYFQSNVNGTFNVLQASKEQEIKRFVYAASSSCYGIPDQYPTPENDPIRPQYPYALTKHLGEELVLHWAQVYELPALSLRFFNVHGLAPVLPEPTALSSEFFWHKGSQVNLIQMVGDGNQTRDFTFVTDVAKAILAAKSRQSGKVYNVGSGATVSVNRLVELLGGEKIHIPKRPGEPDCTFAT